MTCSALRPEKLRESENLMTVIAMEKILLERLLLRKELRLIKMEEKLKKQSEKLKQAEVKLKNYQSLAGLKIFEKISKAFGVLSNLQGKTMFCLGRKVMNSNIRKHTGKVYLDTNDSILAGKAESTKNIDYGLIIIVILTVIPDWMEIVPASFSLI